VATDPEVPSIADGEWRIQRRDWVPSSEDDEFLSSLMRRVTEPGKVGAGSRRPKSIEVPDETIFPYQMRQSSLIKGPSEG
jgi:hypothetical protein